MNKLLFLFATLLLVSCSSGDSANSDSIVGKWYLSTLLFNQEQEILDNCDIQSYLEITTGESGKYYLYYSDDLETEPCGLDIIYDLTYYRVDGSKNYKLTFEFGDDDYQTGDVVINNDTLTFTSEYDGNIYIYTFLKD